MVQITRAHIAERKNNPSTHLSSVHHQRFRLSFVHLQSFDQQARAVNHHFGRQVRDAMGAVESFLVVRLFDFDGIKRRLNRK